MYMKLPLVCIRKIYNHFSGQECYPHIQVPSLCVLGLLLSCAYMNTPTVKNLYQYHLIKTVPQPFIRGGGPAPRQEVGLTYKALSRCKGRGKCTFLPNHAMSCGQLLLNSRGRNSVLAHVFRSTKTVDQCSHLQVVTPIS